MSDTTAVPPVPQFDADRLARAVYLSGPEAAFYLGYTRESYRDPYDAFWKLMRRNGIKPGRVGARLLFRRADIDALINRARA